MAEDKLSREYVVALLKRDAERKAEEYKTRGAAAYTIPPPQKPITTNTNKRFLSNLMKSTHSHNDRILKKDRQVPEESASSRGSHHPTPQSDKSTWINTEIHKPTHREHRSDRRKRSRSRSPKSSHRRHRSRSKDRRRRREK